MNVRGWLMVGSFPTSLPQDQWHGTHVGTLPDPSDFAPGDWIIWWAHPIRVTCVCVEVPL